MSINLSDLTSPNNQDVLAEITSAADFLDPIGKLENLSRGSNKGGHALQTVALNQPKALPLTADSNGVLGGYLYQPDVTGNAPAVNIPSISANEDFVFEMEVYLVDATSFHLASGGNAAQRFGVHSNAFYFAPESAACAPLSTGASTLTVERSGTTATLKQDGVVKATLAANIADNTYDLTHLSFNGQYTTSIGKLNGYIKKATLSIEGTQVFNCDFTATNVRHNDKKLKCATGQVVTINQSGNDPATVIKKSVLRFDGANSFMNGLLNQTVTGGYMFAAFSVLGDGGETFGRIFGMNSTGAADNAAGGFAIYRNASTNNYRANYNGIVGSFGDGLFDDEMGDVLIESDFKNSSQIIEVNNADKTTHTTSGVLSSEEFKIVSFTNGDLNAAIDLEFLALFPASITDAQADSVRNYINNRNNVFDLKDGFGYYFFDAQKAPAVPITSGSSSWNGRIVGSDFGDTNRYATQGTSNHAPVGDGYVVTFADNNDRLEIPQVTQAGWQVVGTSLGTFAYRVNNDAVTELNLLGNLGNASHRQAGQSYGMILLPDSATSADIESARKLLIARGAADGVAPSDCSNFWRGRADIVNFGNISFNSVTDITSAWRGNSSMTTFSVSFPSVAQASNAFLNCSSLSDFGTTDLKNCSNFINTWQNCSALTSFPAGAKLGTEATGSVPFSNAWRGSGLTSFSTPLPTATYAAYAWLNCNSLTSFSSELPLATNVQQAWQGCNSLTSFDTELPLVTNAGFAWWNCTSLTDFSYDVFSNWNPSSITSGVFNTTWDNCTALTAQSVENILTSIDASGKYATSTGASGGSALGDAGIDIDFNGDPLSAATNSAVTSLKSKGWSIIVNNVTL